MVLPTQRPRHHPDTASRVFSGEAVVITPAENTVRMFNRVGSRIWELVDGIRSVEEIARVLTEEFRVDDGEALASVQRFVEELAGKGLISLSEESA
jgi:hypothetical protein